MKGELQTEKIAKKRLWVFNPDCELAIANESKYYMAPANVVRMTRDLACLPLVMADEQDAVWVREKPDETFIHTVCEALNLKSRILTEEEIPENDQWQGEPWGWSPKMCHWFARRGMGKEWSPRQKEGYSRKVAREGLLRLAEQWSIVDKEIIPSVCSSLEEIRQQVETGTYIVKAPWSSSGKGLLRLEKEVGRKEKEWIGGVLQQQKYVMLEKKLNKVQDFAMEFRREGGVCTFVGWSLFSTGGRGEYKGNYIGRQRNIESLLANRLGVEQLEYLKQEMPVMLNELLPFYQGYFGVDMMIYQDKSGRYKIQPCVEINLRYNMGIVALFLSSRYIGESTEGEFAIDYYREEGEALYASRRLQKEFPVVYKNNRIFSGYLNLTPVNERTHFVASVRCY